MAYTRVSNLMVTCPFDDSHRLKESKLQMHIAKCKLNHLDVEKKVCHFNAQHRIDPGEFEYHLLNCPDRDVVDRRAVDSNTYKGFTGVPSYGPNVPVVSDECWDDEVAAAAAPRYIPPRLPPNNGIVEPTPMSKPAERRKLYKELHTMSRDEPEKPILPDMKTSLTDNTKLPEWLPNEISQMAIKRPQEPPNFRNLGLGRAYPSNPPSNPPANSNPRIAANIFGPSPSYPTAQSYSEITYNSGLLGYGRGRVNPAANYTRPSNYQNDYPELGGGIGRGKLHGLTPDDARY